LYICHGQAHIGIVLRNGNIISNSTSGAKFSWEAPLKEYQNYYGGPGKFYRMPGMQVSRTSSTTRHLHQASSDLSGSNAKTAARQIVFHWNAGGGYDDTAGPYHSVFKGDGTKVQKTSYNSRTGGTLYRPNAINLAVAANPDKGLWPKSSQLNAMAQEVVSLAKSWRWTSSSINVKNVPGHGEVGSGKDVGNLSQNISTGRPPSKGPAGSQDNYGPVAWGGTGDRWDLSRLTSGQKIGDGEGAFRNMIIQKMGSRFHGGPVSKGGAYNLHKGEFVVDKYSVDLLGEPFIATINSVKNKTQLNQKVGSLIDHLSHIAGYEPGGMIPIEVEIDNGDDETQIIPVPMTKFIPVGGFGGGGDSYDYTEVLYSHA